MPRFRFRRLAHPEHSQSWTPRYLIRSGALADPPDGVYELPGGGSAEVQLFSSTYTCTDCFPAMRVTDVAESAAAQQVPQPGFGAGLAAGIAGLLAARTRREQKQRV